MILTGEWDPVTPPSNAEGVARSLTNSLNIIVPHGAHGFGSLEGLGCLERLSTEFVEKGTVKDLDPACVKGIRRKGFALKLWVSSFALLSTEYQVLIAESECRV